MPWGAMKATTWRYPARLRARDLAAAVGCEPGRILLLARKGRLSSRKEPNGDVTFPRSAVDQLVGCGLHVRL